MPPLFPHTQGFNSEEVQRENWQAAEKELLSQQSEIDSLAGGAYSDEQAQDAVGGILSDTATIDFTYNDGTPSITADVKDSSITSAKITDGTIVNADISGSAAIDASKVGSGAVNDTEFGYLDGVTSAIQTQIDAKLPSSYLDTDGTLAANSDTKVASQKATKTYADTKYGSGSTILAANGTSSAPGHSYSGDSDTGTYRLGSNVLGIAAGAVEAARFGSNATVGITMQLPVKFVGEVRYDYDTLFLDSSTSYTRTTSSKPFQFVYNYDSSDATYYFNTPSGSVAQIITVDPYASAGLYIPALSLTMSPGDVLWALYDPVGGVWIKLN